MRKRCPLAPGWRGSDATVLADDAEHINLDVERQVHLLVAEAERPIGFVHAAERGLHHALVPISSMDMLAGDRFDPFDDRVRG